MPRAVLLILQDGSGGGGGMFLGVRLHVHFPTTSSRPAYKYLLNARYVHGSGLDRIHQDSDCFLFSPLVPAMFVPRPALT